MDILSARSVSVKAFLLMNTTNCLLSLEFLGQIRIITFAFALDSPFPTAAPLIPLAHGKSYRGISCVAPLEIAFYVSLNLILF